MFIPGLLLLLLSLSSVVEAHFSPFQIHSEDEYGFMVEFLLPPFKIETVQTGHQSCHRIHIPLFPNTGKPGYPEVPIQGTFIQVPQQSKVMTQILETQSGILENIHLCPVPAKPISTTGEVRYINNEAVYQREDFIPENLVAVESSGILRGVNVNRLLIFPFQWNPTTQQLRYFNHLTLQVQFDQPLLSKLTLRVKADSEPYETLLADLIINYPGKIISTSGQQPKRSLTAENNPVLAPQQSHNRRFQPSDALRIDITQTGLYRITYEQLAAVGLQPQFVKPERLHLTHQGEEVALKVVAVDQETLQPGDFIEFYAQGIDNVFTNTNVYWLNWRNKASGKRIVQVNGQVTGEGEPVKVFYERLHLENNQKMWWDTPGAPEQDYWFWNKLTAPDSQDYTLDIPSLSLAFPEAIVRVGFQEASYFQHHTIIELNDITIGDEYWEKQSRYNQEMLVSTELFKPNHNKLTLRLPGDAAKNDSVYHNWIEVEYWRNLEAVNDQLTFTLQGNNQPLQVEINQLSEPNILIYEMTNPYQVEEIVNFLVEKNAKDYHATFTSLATADKTYYVLTEPQIQSPNRIQPWQSNRLKNNKNGADYLLITSQELIAAVEPLCQYRRSQGLRVKSVSVEAIYNEFNGGLSDPAAIKQFLKYAYENWVRPAPTYIFLVGETHVNYKETHKKANQVPTHLSPAAWDDTLIPDDNWYVSVDGEDFLPDMFIGRIPGKTPAEVSRLIEKILYFEKSTAKNPHKVLLVADSETQFEELSETLDHYLPVGFNAAKVYVQEYLKNQPQTDQKAKITQATQDIISSMNEGIMLSNYIGHGVMNKWSGAKGLFEPTDVQQLTNQAHLIFAIMLSCINGYFVDPDNYSLAEEFLLAPAGAIGAFAPSKISYFWEDSILAKEIFSTIFDKENRILGAITTQAKLAAYKQGVSADVIQKFTLFGDPAVTLKEW